MYRVFYVNRRGAHVMKCVRTLSEVCAILDDCARQRVAARAETLSRELIGETVKEYGRFVWRTNF